MAIAKMKKLSLVAMMYDKDVILNALHRTGAAEVTMHEDVDYAKTSPADGERLAEYLSSMESALNVLSAQVEGYEKEYGVKSDATKDGFAVSYEEFMAAENGRAAAEEIVREVNRLTDEKNTLKNELARLRREEGAARIYSAVYKPFDEFLDTAKTRVRLGTVSANVKDNLFAALDEKELCAYTPINADGENLLLMTVTHKSQGGETDGVLSAFGFSACPYSGQESGYRLHNGLVKKIEETEGAIKKNERTVYALKDKIRPLKVYCDYLSFALEKEVLSEKLKETQKTFLLQAYVPAIATETVAKELEGVTKAIYFDFSDPTDTDEPPTLLENNALVGSFEPITNTYSVPHYREFDPNGVMAFFYSLFMGFIIGDMGYGLLMAVVGGYLWWKNRKAPTGFSRLAGAFACGGVFSVFWGALFNSFFGFAIFGAGNTVMPDPQSGRCTFVGIQLPSVLLIACEVGITQLLAGYVCNAVQHFRRGEIADGLFEGIVWAVFSLGVMLAIAGLVAELQVSYLVTVGGILAGGSLLVAMLTAGRKEKLIGKFTKGFGAAYGLINFASDILSYSRLYGLMLSGAVIAGIISTYSASFIVSGNVLLIVLGCLLMLVGHAFNIVISLLGAYIHDARLQYVEFYGRFYEGNGELFTPLGSNRKYVRVLKANKK